MTDDELAEIEKRAETAFGSYGSLVSVSIPALIAEVRRLRGQLDAERAEVAHAVGICYEPDEGPCYPGPHDVVLGQILRDKAALHAAEAEVESLRRTLDDHLASESAETMRADKAETEVRKLKKDYQALFDKVADERLDGYRELAARTANAENKLDDLRAKTRVRDARVGSTLASAGVPLQVIAKALGHSSVRMSERYARPSPESLKSIQKALDQGETNSFSNSEENKSK